MKKVAIIPARGGSKRIPRKNVRDFLGKPIIAYSIEAAIGSGLFDEVMVSTDDFSIAEIAKNYGAKVPFMRSQKNSDDLATTIDVISEVIFEYEKLDMHYEYACCIYPCAPFVSSDRLIDSFKRLQLSAYDCIFPVIRYSTPIQRALRINPDGTIGMFHPEHIKTRSQDLEPAFYDAGQFYFFRVKALIEANQLWTKNTGTFEISDLEGQDIDTLGDWELAQIKFSLGKNNTSK